MCSGYIKENVDVRVALHEFMKFEFQIELILQKVINSLISEFVVYWFVREVKFFGCI